MSWPSQEDLEMLLERAREAPPGLTELLVRTDVVVYLVENLIRLNNESAETADRIDAAAARTRKQSKRARKWRRRYRYLKEKAHEQTT